MGLARFFQKTFWFLVRLNGFRAKSSMGFKPRAWFETPRTEEQKYPAAGMETSADHVPSRRFGGVLLLFPPKK